uniref:Reverse transcriptase zinc-binding domain-containing protein n=1 Tax=Hordeum vulgare subsp. vulgare TaxID=112509 RepID=A0A8I6Y312_HORVV
MRTKAAFFNRTRFIIGNGENTRFWEDTWLGAQPLALQYPLLYNIAQRKQTTVAAVLRQTPLNIQFRRALIGNRWVRWLHLVRRLMDISLSDYPDSIRWRLTTNGTFSVKSMYDHIIDTSPISKSMNIWKVKVPLKIKIFMWFVHKGVVLTKDNLAKRQWKGNKRCSFCQTHEMIKHLFLDCPMAKLLWRSIQITFNITPPTSIHMLFGTWLDGVNVLYAKLIRVGTCAILWAIWNCRNDLVFNRMNYINFLQIIFRATALIRMWSLLTPAATREPLVTGCVRWEMVAQVIFNRYGWRHANRIRP